MKVNSTSDSMARKLSEILRFQNMVKLRFHVTLVYKNCHNSLNFEATGLIFCTSFLLSPLKKEAIQKILLQPSSQNSKIRPACRK